MHRSLWKEAQDSNAVAVDLDGTLAEKHAPGGFDPKVVGEPREGARELLELLRGEGMTIIIYTCRSELEPVKAWLNKHDMYYDHINENPQQPSHINPTKLLVKLQIDDRAISANRPLSEVRQELKERLKTAHIELPLLHSEILSGDVPTKEASDPFWRQGLRIQAAKPEWNSSEGVFSNIAHNLQQASTHGQRRLNEAEQLQDLQSAIQPGYRLQRAISFLRRGDTVTSPIDRLLYR